MPKPLAIVVILFAVFCGDAIASPQQWIEIKSDHFTMLTDENEKQGRQVIDQFERMRWVFHTLFPKANVDPAQPMIIIAAKNYKGFQELEPAAYLAKGQLRLGGLFLKMQDRNYILLRGDVEVDHPYSVVYHEYTHLQFAGASDWMPIWLDEGLAEFMQNTDIRDKDVHLGQPSVNDILYLRQNQLMPLTTLLKVDHNSPYYHEEQKGSVFYAESWALTHYIQVNDRLKHLHQLDDYMTLVRSHEDSVVAATKAFGDLKQLQSALNDYVHAASYKEFVLSSAAAPLNEASYRARPVTEPEADAARADLLAGVGRKDDALALIDQVLKTDPKNAQAYETKGYIAFRDGDQQTARKWYAEAVKLDSKSYLANYYYAAMSIGQVGPEQDPQIESSLRTAIRLNPNFAPSYDQLAIFFAQRHNNLEEAHMLNLHAIELDRSNFGYRLNASSILIAMGKYADAIATLHNAAPMAKEPSEVSLLNRNLQSAQQMQDAGNHTKFSTTMTSGEVVAGDTRTVVVADTKPKHPAETANGPKHEILGVIRHVECSYPSMMDFKIVGTSRTVSLYSANYYNLDLSALGFEPKNEMNPCKDIEGMKARVQYAESSDKSVDGQIVAIELRK
jgi:tetratricopeptide (TPR) repeat protein